MISTNRPGLTPEQMQTVGKIFGERVFSHPDVKPKLQASKIRIQFQYYEERWQPAGTEVHVTIDCGQEPIALHMGACDVKPEVIMRMHADTAHRFFMQKVNVMIAVAKGEIKVKGPLHRAMRMLPMIKPSYEVYKEVLKEMGLNELLNYP